MTGWHRATNPWLLPVRHLYLLLLGCFLASGVQKKIFSVRLQNDLRYAVLRDAALIGLLILSGLAIADSSFNPFLYFRF
ncbi:MAG: hypothetical protein MJ016_00075 [Victivallaceae bacterium]|nr:hypothetical protein [Victivallaceae bacterium]